jgi:alkylation response protein AidB-like acyl-CoA dehydrogenase
MEFNLSAVQQSWRQKAEALGRELAADATAADVVMGAARAGLIDPAADLLAVAVGVEALASATSAGGIALALHAGTVLGLAGDDRFTALARGETVGALALSSDEYPVVRDGRLSGRAAWVAPLTERGVALVGARGDDGVEAVAAALDADGVAVDLVNTAALRGLVCGHVRFDDVPCMSVGATTPFMSRVRVLLAAAGLGMGRRALSEALAAARGHTGHGAGGEQTVQGLLADSATELHAAMLLTWAAASAPSLSLAGASMAKLATVEATQRSVARATQVVGADSFRRGHIVEQLAQDVRALELFAGRTEALREAVAGEVLPHA